MNRTSLVLALVVPAFFLACGAGENTVGTDWPDAGNPQDTGSASDACSGCSVGAAWLAVSPVDSCMVASAGQESTAQVFEVANLGTAASEPLHVTLEGPSAYSFQRVSDTCSGKSLIPSATCRVTVIYAPRSIPATVESADLMVSDGVASVQAPIRGSDGTVTASPAALNFGTVAAGIPSDELFVFVTSPCPTSWTAAIDNPDFVITSNTCTRAYEAKALTGACQIGMRFSPQVPNPSSSTGLLTISASDASSVSVALSGIISPIWPEPAPLTASVALLDLGDVKIGGSRTEIITVDGAKAPPTAVISGSPSFVVATNTCKVPGAPCALQVQFAPSAAGAQSATLTISDGQNTVTVALKGQGLAAPVAPFAATPTALDFGQVQITFTSTPLVFTVSTPSARSFKLTLSDSAVSEMTIIQDTCTGSLLIPAGGTCAIGLLYKPTKVGKFEGTLDISDGTDVVSVHLSGSGWTLL